MSRIAEQRTERLQALDDSALRESGYAADYEAMADILEAGRTGEKAEEEVRRMRKTAEHHRGWASKWTSDAAMLRAQYERTEPSPVGAKPTASDIRKYVEAHA